MLFWLKIILAVLAGSVWLIFLAYMLVFAVTRAIRDGRGEGFGGRASKEPDKVIN